MGAHIVRRAPVQQARRLLQTSQEFGHGVGVETGLLQDLQADAIRLFFISAGKVELFLYGARLHADDSRFRYLRVGVCGEYGNGYGCHGNQAIVLLAGYHACQVMLRDVRDFMA